MKTTVTPDIVEILRSGAEKPLYSVEDWVTLFDHNPADQSFVQQLRAEWQPVAPPDHFCQEMMIFTRNHVLSYTRGGPHLWAHILRVTGTALTIAPEAQIPLDHAFLMGIFHDAGKLDELYSDLSHEEIGALMAQDQLHQRYSSVVINKITRAISKDSDDDYGDVLHNADKLDKIGATGIMRRISGSSDAGYLPMALRKLRDDLKSFPEMSYPTAERLSATKKEFTRNFLSAVVV